MAWNEKKAQKILEGATGEKLRQFYEEIEEEDLLVVIRKAREETLRDFLRSLHDDGLRTLFGTLDRSRAGGGGMTNPEPLAEIFLTLKGKKLKKVAQTLFDVLDETSIRVLTKEHNIKALRNLFESLGDEDLVRISKSLAGVNKETEKIYAMGLSDAFACVGVPPHILELADWDSHMLTLNGKGQYVEEFEFEGMGSNFMRIPRTSDFYTVPVSSSKLILYRNFESTVVVSDDPKSESLAQIPERWFLDMRFQAADEEGNLYTIKGLSGTVQKFTPTGEHKSVRLSTTGIEQGLCLLGDDKLLVWSEDANTRVMSRDLEVLTYLEFKDSHIFPISRTRFVKGNEVSDNATSMVWEYTNEGKGWKRIQTVPKIIAVVGDFLLCEAKNKTRRIDKEGRISESGVVILRYSIEEKKYLHFQELDLLKNITPLGSLMFYTGEAVEVGQQPGFWRCGELGFKRFQNQTEEMHFVPFPPSDEEVRELGKKLLPFVDVPRELSILIAGFLAEVF